MKRLYLSETGAEIKKHSVPVAGKITEKDLARLPEPVQRYFRRCGYVGREKMTNARIAWGDCRIRTAPGKKWLRLDCLQFNSVPEPARFVYMKSRLFGVLPFEARGKCQDGRGNMLIKFLKVFTVADARGPQMDSSALVTVLAETFLVPAYALQDYIGWRAVDKNTAAATLRFNDIEVSGVFYFNESGEFIRFETNDRFYFEKGIYKKMGWSASAGDYAQKDGIRIPTVLSAAWHTDKGDFEYFKGRLLNIDLNVTHPA